MKKIIILKIFAVLNLNAFYFEIISFSSPGSSFSLILHLLQLVCGIQITDQFYLTGMHLEFLEGEGLNFSKIGANLYQESAFIG